MIMTDKRTNLDSESLETFMCLCHGSKYFLLKKEKQYYRNLPILL